MSILTTSVLQVAPPAQNMLNLSDGGGAWVWGPYVAFLTVTTAATSIAGICINEGGAYAQLEGDIGIGVGAAGFEEEIGTIRIFGPNSGTDLPGLYLLPVPISGIDAGARVSLRLRRTGTSTDQPFGLLYYNDFNGDATDHPLTSAPLATNSALVDPGASPWETGDPVELLDGVDHQVSPIAIVMSTPDLREDIEYDLLSGALGEEVVFTTLRTSVLNAQVGKLAYLNLPAMYRLPRDTRVSIQIRTSSGYIGNSHKIDLIYYDVAFTPPTTTYVIRRQRRWLLPSSPNQAVMTIPTLQILLRTGIGLQTGQGSDPQIMLRISKDGGKTWSHQRTATAGAIGAYQTRVQWLRATGRYRNAVAEVTVSDPVDWQFVSALALDVREGSS